MPLSIRMLLISLPFSLAAGCGQPASTAQTPAAATVDEAAIRAGTVIWADAYNAAGRMDKDGVSFVGISADLAWHAGTSSVVDAAGKTVETGKYIEVWRTIDGKWLMVRDIWNDDAPPAPVPTK